MKNSKLSIKKRTISNLDKNQMAQVKGGLAEMSSRRGCCNSNAYTSSRVDCCNCGSIVEL